MGNGMNDRGNRQAWAGRPDPAPGPARGRRAEIDPPARTVRDTDSGPAGPGRCRDCGRRHGTVVRCLADGRWFDADDQTWRDRRGRRAPWPNVVEYAGVRDLAVAVREVRLSGDAAARPRKLCKRCQMAREALHAALRNRLRALGRRAVGDLFLGRYDVPDTLGRFTALAASRPKAK